MYQTREYEAVQAIFWNTQRKRTALTPVTSGLTTPPAESGGDVEMEPATASPGLLQPFSLQDQAALATTLGAIGVNINQPQEIENWLDRAPATNREIFGLVRAYHEQVIRPEYYTLVCQLETGLKSISDNVFKMRQELAWMSSENRLQQKYACGLQVLTTGWPPALKPAEREYTITWMLSQVKAIETYLKIRKIITDQTAHELYRYMAVLQTDPTTVPQQNDFYSTMTMLNFRNWDMRQAFMQQYGGSQGIPVYRDESTPIHNKHVRVAPSSPQWQRKLESPLRVLLACINKHPDHTASSRLTILWKTLTLLEPQSDAEFNPEVKAWARLFYSNVDGNFRGRLEVVEDLKKIVMSPPSEQGAIEDTLWAEQWNALMWGPQHELDRTESAAFQTAKAAAAVTGKGMNHGKGGRHWSQVAIYSSDYAPYPFELDFLTVDAVHFVWDEMCDKFRKEEEKIGNYQLATVQGKPPKGAGTDQTANASSMAPPATINPKAKAGKGTGGGNKSA